MLDDSRKYRRNLKQTIDWKLIICYVILVFFGWLNIYASVHSSDPSSIFDFASRSGKQFVWILTSFGLAGLILFVFNPRLWEVISVPSYSIVLFLLILVIFVSKDVKGSHSWFELGPIKFQPAEISKITTALVLSMVMSKPGFRISRIKDFLKVTAIVALPMLAILGESETGSALVYLGFVFVMYREGFSGWFLAFFAVAVLLFIITLTASPYASILTLTALLSLCWSLYNGKLKRWLTICAPYLILMSLLPLLLRLLCSALVPEAAVAEDGAELVENVSSWSFLLNIRPMYILAATLLLPLPYFIMRAYRDIRTGVGVTLVAFAVGVALIFSTSFIFDNILQDHQRKRIEVLLGMKEDPSGVGYNVNQSKIAIGSGGFSGKGFLNGTQTTYGFVPEQSTDFIFCTVGEEWGFLGCAAVILLYVFMIWRIIDDAEKSREAFTRIYGYCVASCIFMHLIINVGMTVGLMPVIGIPLPLLSYGGSSLWAFTILIFIFIALNREEKKYF